MGDVTITEFAFLIFLFWVALYLIAYGLLRLLFKFYFKEYEMDTKSMSMISLKIAAAFLVTSVISFFIARRLFIKSGMEKKDALKISALWVTFMAVVVAVLIAIQQSV